MKVAGLGLEPVVLNPSICSLVRGGYS